MTDEPKKIAERTLRRSLLLVVTGGALAMIYSTGVGSPATTEFYRAIGANEFHFGLISGIPMIMVMMQFVGAAWCNRISSRKGIFIVSLISCRLLFIVVAALPWIWPGGDPDWIAGVLVLLLAFSAALHNVAIPMWFSWMADIVPRRLMNRFWGWRQRWMHSVWALSFLSVTLFLYFNHWPVQKQFPLIIGLALIAGIVDILLFIWVEEPTNMQTPEVSWRETLVEPWLNDNYRRFVTFNCMWNFATMFAAAFMTLFMLKVIGLSVWQTTLIWCLQGVGVSTSSRFWGKLADRFGQKPVMSLCVHLKPLTPLMYLLLTRENVFWILPAWQFLDGVLNSGSMMATNGYMLKSAPQGNRSMFIATITGLAGVCSGLAAMAAGAFLRGMEDWQALVAGWHWGNYHLVFVISFFLRLGCLPFLWRLREPAAYPSLVVLNEILGEFPQRFLRFPVGLYRRMRPLTREEIENDDDGG